MGEWQSEATKALIGLVGAGIGGFVSYRWHRRRTSDKELFLMLRGAFDRPAFKGRYQWHSDHQAFQQAIATTLKPIKTGKLFDRRGQELAPVEGRYPGTFLVRNRTRREALREVEDCLQRIYQLSKQVASSLSSPNLTAMPSIDEERDKVIRTLNLIRRALGIAEMRLPTESTL